MAIWGRGKAGGSETTPLEGGSTLGVPARTLYLGIYGQGKGEGSEGTVCLGENKTGLSDTVPYVGGA